MSDSIDILLAAAFKPFREALEAAYYRGREDEKRASIDALKVAVGCTKGAVRPQPEAIMRALQLASGVQDFQQRKGLISRSRRYHDIRHAGAVLLREDADLSYSECGRFLGYDNHTSVMYALKHWTDKPRVVALVGRVRDAITNAQGVA